MPPCCLIVLYGFIRACKGILIFMLYLTKKKVFILLNYLIEYSDKNISYFKIMIFVIFHNKVVMIIKGWTLRKFENLDMIRLYGNSLENKDYPIPGKHFATSASSKENRPDPALKNISVHNLIRQDDSLHSSEINDFDCKFDLFRSGKSYKPTIRDIRRFKHIVSEAAQEELKKHDVIFCTTAVTTSPRFIKGTRGKIFQLIIDEAGMCTEPESIAAIIATKAKQVVLIGDHKQLSPVISSTHAAEIGLQVSLFESYAHLAKMLRFQYRMVIFPLNLYASFFLRSVGFFLCILVQILSLIMMTHYFLLK